MKEKVRENLDIVYQEALETTKTNKLIEYDVLKVGTTEALFKLRPRDIDLYTNFFQF